MRVVPCSTDGLTFSPVFTVPPSVWAVGWVGWVGADGRDWRSVADVFPDLVADDDFVAQAERLVDRLRSMSISRLERESGEGSVARRAWQLAGEIAVEAGHREGLELPPLPWIGVHAVPDQLAVVSVDLGVAAAEDDEVLRGFALRCRLIRIEA